MRDAMQTLQDAADARQHHRILRLSFPNGDGPAATLLVNRLHAEEGLSRPFAYTLELLSDDALIELKHLQGKLLCVALVRRDGTLRHFSGRVFAFGLRKVDGGLAYWSNGWTVPASRRALPTTSTARWPASPMRSEAQPSTVAIFLAA